MSGSGRCWPSSTATASAKTGTSATKDGTAASARIDAGDGFPIVTSRASYELAMKTAQVGIPLLAAISAPTTLAIALADSARLCLVGFARDGHCAVYAHPERLALTSAESSR